MYNVLYFCNVVELNGIALHEFAILTLKFANWFYLTRETGTNKYFIGWDQLVFSLCSNYFCSINIAQL